MKMPIEWHKRCLENFSRTIERQRQFVEREKANLERMEKRHSEETAKYAEAVLRNVSAYDPDKFGKKRNAKANAA